MPTQEYRFIIIENKVITRADVQKLANELYSLYNKKGRTKKKAIEFQVFCEENAVFKSGDPEIFSSNSPIISKRVIRIEMRAGFESEAISIQLLHDLSTSQI